MLHQTKPTQSQRTTTPHQPQRDEPTAQPGRHKGTDERTNERTIDQCRWRGGAETVRGTAARPSSGRRRVDGNGDRGRGMGDGYGWVYLDGSGVSNEGSGHL